MTKPEFIDFVRDRVAQRVAAGWTWNTLYVHVECQNEGCLLSAFSGILWEQHNHLFMEERVANALEVPLTWVKSLEAGYMAWSKRNTDPELYAFGASFRP